jgi:hypothetical protein
MEKYYITADKIGQFCQVMWNKGYIVIARPDRGYISVEISEGKFKSVHILPETSFIDVVNMFPEHNVASTNEDNI